MTTNHSEYASFLLRVWRTDSAEPPHAALIDVSTGKEIRFRDLGSIVPFVLSALGECEQSAEDSTIPAVFPLLVRQND